MNLTFSNTQLSLLIGLWLIACSAAFWLFEYRHWSHWDRQLALFSSEQLATFQSQIAGHDGITVMHFRTEGCPCTAYQDAHIAQLQSTLKATIQMNLNETQRRVLNIPLSTPSVAIWDRHGRLAYFGPYSSGAVCGQGVGFVERTVETLKQGHNPLWINTQGIGCFCRDASHTTSSSE